MSVTTELATYLQAESVGTVGTDIFEGQLPPAPDDCLAVIPYGGQASVYTLGQLPDWERPRVQVLVRNVSFAGAEATALAAYNALAKVANALLSGVRYVEITPLQSPFLLRRDDSGRVEFAANYAVQKAVS